jgi:anti-sigma factor (TIGR02949 family)
VSGTDANDCQAAVERLYDFLDGELTAADAAAVRQHLAACTQCVALFDYEAAFLRFLEARRAAAGAPPALRRAILERLLREPS